jgi:hypothetical protein
VREIKTGKWIDAAQERAAHTAADAVVVGCSGERYQAIAGLRHAYSVPAEEPDGYRRFTFAGVGNLLGCGCPIYLAFAGVGNLLGCGCPIYLSLFTSLFTSLLGCGCPIYRTAIAKTVPRRRVVVSRRTLFTAARTDANKSGWRCNQAGMCGEMESQFTAIA